MGEEWRLDQSKEFEFSGSHYQMGKQQGRAFKANLKAAFDEFKKIPAVQMMKPRFLPTSLFFKIASSKAYKGLNEIFEKHLPHHCERISGIAEGADISEKMIYLLASTELILAERKYEIPSIEGCTTICYERSKTERGHNMAARNFDYQRIVVPYLVVRKNSPKDRYKTLDVTATPLAGTFNGMNEKGVFIGTNEGSPIGELDGGLPASLLIQEALETCATSQEVFELFKSLPRGTGNIVVVNDAEGNNFAMEYTSKRIYKRTDDRNFLVGTNHYQLEQLKSVDLPKDAIYTEDADPRLVGLTITEDSYLRVEDATELIKRKEILSIGDMQSIMSNHGGLPEKEPGRMMLCRHGPVMQTAASMIADCETKELFICIGNPCDNEYLRYNL